MKVFFLFGFLIASIIAEESIVETFEEDEFPAAADEAAGKVDVSVVHVMPDNPFSMVVNGEIAAILLSVRNTGDIPLRIIGLQGQFTQPGAYDKVIRNITRMPYYMELPVNEEHTVNYRFKTDFEPAEVGFTVDIDYVDSKDRFYRSRAFAQNLTIADPETKFDLELAFVYLFGVLSIGGTGILVRAAFFSKKQGGKKARTSSNASGVDESWLPSQLKKRDVKKRK